MPLEQFIPQGFCLKCKGCCRFKEENSIWQPSLIEKLTPYKDFYICPELEIDTNYCKIYDKRPIDCQLYPFLLHRKNGKVFLALDKKCPFFETRITANRERELPLIENADFKAYVMYLIDFLNQPDIKSAIRADSRLINNYQEDAVIISEIKDLSLNLGLNLLRLEDKPLFDKFLKLKKHTLSTYSFANIFIWFGLFDIFYKVIQDNLCVFLKDKIGMFMYLAPLGENVNVSVVEEIFEIMNSFNANNDISRIENVEEGGVNFYKSLGFNCLPKFPEYIYKTEDIVNLSGEKFKSHRASFNSFINNLGSQTNYQSYDIKMKDECVMLLSNWVARRKQDTKDSLYNACLDDSFLCQKIALENYNALDLIGRVVKIDGKISAFSFGYKLNPARKDLSNGVNNDTFCILFETTDLTIKGLSQFIFSKIAREFSECKFLNCLDDSGFSSLKNHKLSYNPYKLEPSYIVKRN